MCLIHSITLQVHAYVLAYAHAYTHTRTCMTVCFIHSFALQPYQAWWQVPLNVKPPVYAPREVFVEFGALDEEVVYARGQPILKDTHTHTHTHTHTQDLDAQGQPILQDKWLVSAASARRDVPHSSNNATADQALTCSHVCMHTEDGEGGVGGRDTQTHTHAHRDSTF